MTIERVPKRPLAHIVEFNGKYFYIDSCFTFDEKYETMVFTCDKAGKVRNAKSPVYVAVYKDAEEMRIQHDFVVKNLKKILEEKQ